VGNLREELQLGKLILRRGKGREAKLIKSLRLSKVKSETKTFKKGAQRHLHHSRALFGDTPYFFREGEGKKKESFRGCVGWKNRFSPGTEKKEGSD